MAYGAAIQVLAFDRSSVRSYDRDGRLHVAWSNISKAAINQYLGREIPDWERLGLQPDKLYRLFRDPEEIEKAAPTFNNLPLLSRHVAVTVDSHSPELVIGSTGTDAEFKPPYLGNSLVIWTRPGIDAVESEEQKELSSAYRYRADMTPGVFNGERYDGVMRDIVGNHVALVKEGRAGDDVVVGDSNEELAMATKKKLLSGMAVLTMGALAAALAPKLAMDAKVDLKPILADVTAKNFKESKPKIVAALTAALEGKLAKDASIDDVAKLLDVLESHDVARDVEVGAGDPVLEPNNGTPLVLDPDKEAKDEDDPLSKVKAFLVGKLSDEDMAQVEALCRSPGAGDEPPPFKGKPKAGGGMDADPDKKDDDKDKDMVKKPAMDAAIAAAVKAATEHVTKTQREIRDAERAVRPYVGELAIACDSADKVYEAALKALGIDVKGVHPSAFPTILGMQKKPGEREPRIAKDSAPPKDFDARWGDAAKRVAVL